MDSMNLPNVDEHLERVREKLLYTGTYLASDLFSQIVSWQACDGKLKIVQPASTFFIPDLDEFDVKPPTKTEIASLSAVVKIAADDFHFDLDKGWTSTDHNNITNITLTLSGGSPTIEPFQTDYLKTVDNLKWLVSQLTGSPNTATRGLLIHQTFAPRISLKYRIPNVYFGLFRYVICLTSRVKIHHPTTLPDIYDMNGIKVIPIDYQRTLVNATVAVEFELTNWNTLPENRSLDHFSADIITIRTVLPLPTDTVV
ncbi:hypothetical protein BDQ17DRAFT_1330735 [Cyathus striatus]|nr:hypothetical protein BDQ17DRAFT_1330735 [Cyathus striatus]